MKDFNLIQLDSTPSTQNYLVSLCKEAFVDEFTIVSTFDQTAGKGQANHIWESEKNKNLSFSILLRPKFVKVQEQFILSKTVSIAITDFLAKYIKDNIFIKWPNDIYINKNKICGILCQNQIIGSTLDNVIIGIGININQKKFDFAPNPTSLAMENGIMYNLNTLLIGLIDCIQIRYNQLKKYGRKTIDSEYLQKLLFKNEFRQYIYLGNKITAKIINVNSFGHLVLEDKNANVFSAELRQLNFQLD